MTDMNATRRKPSRMRTMTVAGGIAVIAATGMASTASAATSSASPTLAKIKSCESGGNYQAVNSSSGASGAYQFLDSTWKGLSASSGYATAASAPASVQDAAALELYNQAGTSPWAASSSCWSSMTSTPTSSSSASTSTTTSKVAGGHDNPAPERHGKESKHAQPASERHGKRAHTVNHAKHAQPADHTKRAPKPHGKDANTALPAPKSSGKHHAAPAPKPAAKPANQFAGHAPKGHTAPAVAPQAAKAA